MNKEIWCGICHILIHGWTWILPIRSGSGTPTTIACERCAHELGLICLKHNMPFQGYLDGTVACSQCVEDKTYAMVRKATHYLQLVDKVLEDHEVEAIDNLAKIQSEHFNQSWVTCKLRLIALVSERENIPVRQVIRNMESADSLIGFFGP